MAPERLRATLLGAIIATAALPARLPAQDPAPAAQAQAPAAEDPAKVQARIATVLDGTLVDTRNGDGLMLETAGYRRLLQLVNATDPAAVTSRVTTTLDSATDRAEAMKNPDALRGEWV